MKSTDLRLLLQSGGSRRLFLIALLGAGLWSVIIVVNAILIAEVIVGLIHREPGVLRHILALGSLWLIRTIFSSRFEYWCTSQAIRIKRDLRSATTSNIANYEAISPGELSNLLTKGLNSLDIYLGRFIPQMVFAAVVPLAVIFAIFVNDPFSALITILTLPLIPFFGALIGKFSADAVASKWQSLGTLSRYFEDSLRGFVTLKIFGRHKSQSQRISSMGQKYTDETMKVLRISFLSALALELVATLSVAVIAVSVGLRLVSGSMHFTPALVILILAPDVYFPVRNAASLFHASEDGTQALAAINSLIQSPDAPSSQPAVSIDRESIHALTWNEWNFSPHGSPGIKIPAGRIARGQMIFLVGESGIGKTTFASNLLGIAFRAEVALETDDGVLLLSRRTQSQWQKLFGWIPQTPQLATGSVRDQFLLLSPAITDSQISAAIARAGLEISELPQGLDTQIGRSGEQANAASGGQIRRIAVARALCRNPMIVIADEPTADLDEASASQVMLVLRELQAQGAIVMCITHDTSLPQMGEQVISVIRGDM